MKNKTKALVIAFLSLAINIATFANVTFAWLNKTVTSADTDTAVAIKSPINFEIQSKKVMYWDESTEAGVLDATDTALENYNLESYDTYITFHNKYKARYLILELYFYQSFNSGSKFRTSIEGNSSIATYASGSYAAKKTSNVAQFKMNFVSSLPTEADSTYSAAYESYKTSFNSLSSYTFIDESKVGDSATVASVGSNKKSQIDCDITLSSSISSGETKYFVIEYDYSEVLTNFLVNNCEGKSAEELDDIKNGTNLELSKDISQFSFGIIS